MIEGTSGPPGADWSILPGLASYSTLIGPFYGSMATAGQDEPIRVGCRIDERHCNSGPVCHGGMLATLLDVALGYAARSGLDLTASTPTISLSMDFLAPVPLGWWLESRVRILKRTQRLAFVDGLLLGHEGPVVRGSAVFRLPRIR